MYKIIIPKYVMEDIYNIKEYIFRISYSIETSNKIYNEIMANILALKIFPSSYPIFKKDLRVLTVRKKYRVFYKINEEKQEVQIYYIFWTEQDYNSIIHWI